MSADNHGEGGILALMSLVAGRGYGRAPALVMMGLFGAALIYGDGIITPAISVLSALEGVNVASDALKPYVMPLSVVILLVGLFAVQNRGTARIRAIFGPVMLLWFIVIGVLGVVGIVHHPAVIAAIDPRHGISFLVKGGWKGFAILGGVFLAITGGEALYADMGHIGRNPIRMTVVCGIVLPALLLNYAGQIALLIAEPGGAGWQPVLSPGAELEAIYPAGCARDRGDDHRQPGDHHRLVFVDPAGDAARLVPGGQDPPDLGHRIRPDLRADDQLADDADDPVLP